MGERKSIGMVLMTILILSSLLISIVIIPREVSAYTPHDPIIIDGNGDFTAVNGVIGGSGTSGDPYIIEGWEINISNVGSESRGYGRVLIWVENTDIHFIIRNVALYLNDLDTGQDGISFVEVSNGTIENCIITSIHDPMNRSVTKYGIELYQVHDISIKNNRISHLYMGIEIGGGDSSVIQENNISDCKWGIMMGGSISPMNNSIFSKNTFYNNYAGITISSRDSRNVVFNNNFMYNEIQARDFGADQYRDSNGTFWDNGYSPGGNYWSDYSGIDGNSDGIGDIPYEIDTDSRDIYPLMEPYVIKAENENLITWVTFGLIIGIITIASTSLYYLIRKRKSA